ncbi:MAG: AAA family ATPase, partial [Frankiaceae bacterium]|nr:AAA family ATPase [Frankiaceae bacterium]
QDPLGGLAPAIAAAAIANIGLDTMHLDLDEMDDDDRVDDVLGEALVRAHLDSLAIVAGPASKVVSMPDRVARLAAGDVPFVLYGPLPWRPGLLTSVPWQLAPVPATKDDRVVVWQQALDVASEQRGADPIPGREDIARAVGHLHLSPPAVNRAVLSAGLQALGEQRPLGVDDLVTAARTQSGEALQRLARRITPRVGWDDLVVPPAVVEQLEEMCTRARQRDLVMGTWKVGGGSSRKRGTVALFGGPPGTGKSLAAEVIGAALGLEIYQVNLATVVDKYVGETEKNLDRIFRAAEGVNCLLFFDEADALFGRRSEVSSAQDKYANVEVAFLLQRLEDFDGVAVLASNLRGNLDDAFRRRIDVLVDFPVPDEAARLQLWRTCLGPHVQLADDVDLAVCAKFELAGGDIRNVTVGAAMAAAEAGQPVGMAHLVRAVQTEYRKLGRLADQSAFAIVKKYVRD